jgi:hypothetical protein
LVREKHRPCKATNSTAPHRQALAAHICTETQIYVENFATWLEPASAGQFDGHMAEAAAHLTDHIFPRPLVRQWVLSMPKRLR